MCVFGLKQSISTVAVCTVTSCLNKLDAYGACLFAFTFNLHCKFLNFGLLKTQCLVKYRLLHNKSERPMLKFNLVV